MTAKDQSSMTSATPPPPNPLPSPRRSRRVAPPAFDQTTEALITQQNPPITPPNGDDAPPPAEQLPPPEPGDDAPSDPPETATGRGSSRVFSASRDRIREAIATGLRSGVGFLNENLTRDELARDAGVWLADDQDVDGVADPLSGIVMRRGDLAAITNPDLADAIGGAIALAIYAGKQFALRMQLRRWRRANGSETAFPPPAEPAPEATS